jgi:hypothetical protein
MNMNHPLRVMLPLAGFCVAFAVMAQTPPNPQGQSQPNQHPQAQQPPAAAVPPQNQTQGAPQASPQPNQPSMTTLGGPNNTTDNSASQQKAQLRQQAIQMIEQGLNQLRQSQ